jgi:hypothetical protein
MYWQKADEEALGYLIDFVQDVAAYAVVVKLGLHQPHILDSAVAFVSHSAQLALHWFQVVGAVAEAPFVEYVSL